MSQKEIHTMRDRSSPLAVVMSAMLLARRLGAALPAGRLIVTLALYLALSLAGRSAAAAVYEPPLGITVAPAIVTAGSGGNTLTFTLTARKRAVGSVVVVVPTVQSGSPWTMPQSLDVAQPGYVIVQKETCAKASLAALMPASVAGSWAAVINFKCRKGKAFSIVYGGGTGTSKVTAASSIGSYEFATLTRKRRWRAKDTGRPDTAKGFTALALQPVVAVAADPAAIPAAGPAATLHVTGPSETASGSQQSITVTALDQYGNTATAYGGTVGFTSTDAGATLPADATLTSGVGTFPVTLMSAGPQTVTATDTGSASLTGQLDVLVAASPAAVLVVAGPSTATSGSPQSITVTARDPYGNTATDYGGTVHFSSSDQGATLPADATLTSGVGTFPVTLVNAGSQTVTATDVSNAALTGELEITVTASNLFVYLTEVAKAWVPLTVVVEARDDNGNLASEYDGTVHFASSDDAATLPADATLAGGQGAFPVTFRTAAELHTLTVTDMVRPLIGETSFGVSGPRARGVVTTFLNPESSQIAVSTVGVLSDDSIPAPDVTEIVRVGQAIHRTPDPHQAVQVGVVTIAPGGRVIIWDLNPPDTVEPENPNVPLVRCSVADGSGCDLPNPIDVAYLISDGVNESLATETLIIETPDYLHVLWDPDAGQHEVTPAGIVPISFPNLLIPYSVPVPVTAVTEVDRPSGFTTFTISGPLEILGMANGNFSVPMTVAVPPSTPSFDPGFSLASTPLFLSVQPPPLAVTGGQSSFRSVQIIKPQVGTPDQIDAQWQGSLFNVGDSFCTGQCCARPGSFCRENDNCCSQNCVPVLGPHDGECACRTAGCTGE